MNTFEFQIKFSYIRTFLLLNKANVRQNKNIGDNVKKKHNFRSKTRTGYGLVSAIKFNKPREAQCFFSVSQSSSLLFYAKYMTITYFISVCSNEMWYQYAHRLITYRVMI